MTLHREAVTPELLLLLLELMTEERLSYFEDAEVQPDPRSLRNQNWEAVKSLILRNSRL